VITTDTVLHQLAQLSLMEAYVLLGRTFHQMREGRRLLLTAAPAQLESTALLVEWLEPVLLAISARVELRHQHLQELHRVEPILALLATSVHQVLPSSRSAPVACTHTVQALARRQNARHARVATIVRAVKMNQSSALTVTTALLALKVQSLALSSDTIPPRELFIGITASLANEGTTAMPKASATSTTTDLSTSAHQVTSVQQVPVGPLLAWPVLTPCDEGQTQQPQSTSAQAVLSIDIALWLRRLRLLVLLEHIAQYVVDGRCCALLVAIARAMGPQFRFGHALLATTVRWALPSPFAVTLHVVKCAQLALLLHCIRQSRLPVANQGHSLDMDAAIPVSQASFAKGGQPRGSRSTKVLNAAMNAHQVIIAQQHPRCLSSVQSDASGWPLRAKVWQKTANCAQLGPSTPRLDKRAALSVVVEPRVALIGPLAPAVVPSGPGGSQLAPVCASLAMCSQISPRPRRLRPKITTASPYLIPNAQLALIVTTKRTNVSLTQFVLQLPAAVVLEPPMATSIANSTSASAATQPLMPGNIVMHHAKQSRSRHISPAKKRCS
jgi:hypothetical protein